MWRKKINGGIMIHCFIERRNLYWLALGAVLLFCGRAAGQWIFGTPENLGPTVNAAKADACPSISADGLTLYFSDTPYSPRPTGKGGMDIWVTNRMTTGDPWVTPIGCILNTGYDEGTPNLSNDGLTLFFASNRSGGYGNQDLWASTRSEPNRPWEPPMNLGPTVNSGNFDSMPFISADRLSLYYYSQRPGGLGSGDLWVTTRSEPNKPWETPVNLGTNINSAYDDGWPSLSTDGLTLFFNSNRPGGYGNYDLYIVTRQAPDGQWSPSVNLGPSVNSSSVESTPNISADGRSLFFASDRPGGYGNLDLWQVSVNPEPMCGDEEHPYPISDLNLDCIVNMLDLAMMCEHWLEDNNP